MFAQRIAGTLLFVCAFTATLSQSALEVAFSGQSVSFEHWYFTTLDEVHPNLEFFNYTYAARRHSGEKLSSTLLNPFIGYNVYKGLGLVASVSFLATESNAFVGAQYSQSFVAHNVYAALSYSSNQQGIAELFVWYLYQPLKNRWNPFIQVNAVGNWGARHNFSQLRARFGPAYRSHSLGIAFDADWDSQWKSSRAIGLYYRYQLQ